MDGLDNDSNGFIDCSDFECTMASRGATTAAIEHCASLPVENTLVLCMNGIDDDGDLFTDCDDFSCSREEDGAEPDAAAFCADAGEASYLECRNGRDDDGDGFADCADFSCLDAPLDTDPISGLLRHPCDETPNVVLADPLTLCTNGRDDDDDGFTDCNDFDCNWHPSVQAMCSAMGIGVCRDPRD